MFKANWKAIGGMGQTSIPVREEVRDTLAADKADGTSWSDYLLSLHGDGESGDGGSVAEAMAEASGPSRADIDTLADDIDDVLEELNDLKVFVDRLPYKTAEQTAEELEGRFS